jgi:transcriptional regulator with AAA-type ATPase domain
MGAKTKLTRDRMLKAVINDSNTARPLDAHAFQRIGGSAQFPYDIVVSPREFKIASALANNGKVTAVLIGETGTGKEEFARLIHKLRSEAESRIPFVSVNCATITENLAESLLFGHRRGAFTGAEESTQGYIHEANGGILFLDEIHTLSLSVQRKLLRVLNDGTYNRLGETIERQSHFQLIAATTRDLDDEVDRGRFLLDLRSRITGYDIHLKPLRERLDDIPALLSLHLARKGIEISKRLFRDLSEHLKGFYWRGNIRQLFKALDSWVLQSTLEDIPLSIESFPVMKGMLPPDDAHKEGEIDLALEISKAIYSDSNLDATLSRIEMLMIQEAITRHKSVGNAAKALGLSRSTIDAKRRKYGLA